MKTSLVVSRLATLLVLAAVIFGPVSYVTPATTGGPPSGFTNAPREGNCTSCHGGFALNSGTAVFSISAPVSYAPGTAQPIGVAFTNSASTKHGFEITARDGAGNPSGSWSVTMVGMTKNASGTTAYHEHTSSGTSLSSWTMAWNAPASLPNGPVTFYAAGADTNNNGSSGGDHIYAKTTKLYQATLATPSTTWAVGASHALTLTVPGNGGDLYFIVPSDNPAPFPITGPFVLEVTPNDIFFSLVPQLPQVFQNLTGTLNAAGQASASVVVPFYPALAGLQFHFAAATATPALAPTEVSNRLTVTFQ